MSVTGPEAHYRAGDHTVSGADGHDHRQTGTKGRTPFESVDPLESLTDGIDLTPEFLERGEAWSELDADGDVVIRNLPPAERPT